MPQSSPHYCPQHPKEVLKIYCKSCNILVCCNCIVNAHQGHAFGSIDMDTHSKVEEVLEEMTYSAKKTLAELSINLKYENITCRYFEKNRLRPSLVKMYLPFWGSTGM